MIHRLQNLLAHLSRAAAAFPLRALSLGQRAELMEQLLPDLTVEVSARGRTLHMSATTPLLLARARNLLTKELDTIAWIDGFPADTVFWDVGANVGAFSLYAALQHDTTVLAFEPGAANYDVLCRNIRLNGLSNARAYCIAFSRETGLGVLNMTSDRTGAALNQFGDEGDTSPYAARSAGNAVQGMIGMSIDDFVARFDPPFPGYLKIDVDGIERPILRGATRMLRDLRLKSLLVELSVEDEAERSEVISLLGDCGFALTSRGEAQIAPVGAGCNHIFSRDGVAAR